MKCKYADCVEVCPVECFYEGDDMLYINPDECIDCDACAPACPVQAIVPEDDAEQHAEHRIDVNMMGDNATTSSNSDSIDNIRSNSSDINMSINNSTLSFDMV